MTQWFSAEPVDGGVRVDMHRTFAWGIGRVIRQLSLSYRRGNPLYALRRPAWMPSHASLLRRLYPEVAQSPKESAAFLRRHRDVLADRALVERVRARWRGPRPFVLTHAEVDEWIAVLGQARLLLEAQAYTKRAIPLLSASQELLVMAVAPDTFAGPDREQETGTDQTA